MLKGFEYVGQSTGIYGDVNGYRIENEKVFVKLDLLGERGRKGYELQVRNCKTKGCKEVSHESWDYIDEDEDNAVSVEAIVNHLISEKSIDLTTKKYCESCEIYAQLTLAIENNISIDHITGDLIENKIITKGWNDIMYQLVKDKGYYITTSEYLSALATSKLLEQGD